MSGFRIHTTNVLSNLNVKNLLGDFVLLFDFSFASRTTYKHATNTSRKPTIPDVVCFLFQDHGSFCPNAKVILTICEHDPILSI